MANLEDRVDDGDGDQSRDQAIFNRGNGAFVALEVEKLAMQFKNPVHEQVVQAEISNFRRLTRAGQVFECEVFSMKASRI